MVIGLRFEQFSFDMQQTHWHEKLLIYLHNYPRKKDHSTQM